MIISTLIYLFSGLANLILSVLPDFEVLPDGLENAINLVGTFIGNLAYVLNATEVFFIINLVLQLLGYVMIWKVGNWAYNKLRGSGN